MSRFPVIALDVASSRFDFAAMIRRSRQLSFQSMIDWDALFERAENIVNETVATLPDDVKAEAERVPCLFRQWARDIYGRPALGLYTAFHAGHVSEEGGLIFIFAGDIFRECGGNEHNFADEVRRTYLHELGHHLGWDEGDLRRRGLD